MSTNRIREWLETSGTGLTFTSMMGVPFAAVPLAFFPANHHQMIAAVYEAALEQTRRQVTSQSAWDIEFSLN